MRVETKPRYVVVTDPAEIAAVRLENETGRLDLPIGGFANGQCFAVAWSLERYRQTLRDAAGSRGGRDE